MRAYILTSFIISSIVLLLSFVYLAVGDYPRKIERSRAYDVITIVFGLGWLAWQVILLWGHK